MPIVRPCVVEVHEQVEHLELVREVEVGRGLVEQQDRRVLRERHRDPGALALAAAERSSGRSRRSSIAGGVQRPVDLRAVLVGRAAAELLVREAAAVHEVLDRQPLGRDRRLRQEPEPLRDLARGQRA